MESRAVGTHGVDSGVPSADISGRGVAMREAPCRSRSVPVCVCVCVRRHGALGEHRRFIVTRRCVQWGWSGQDRPLPPSQAQLPGRGLVM